MPSRPLIVCCYPPGLLYQRGEDRCQCAIEQSSATSMRAANDLGYAAAVLRERGYRVAIRDWQTSGVTDAEAFTELARLNPALVLLSVTNASIEADLVFARAVRELLGDEVTIVLKGAIFWDMPQAVFDLIDFTVADYLIGGEVEHSIGALADYLFAQRGVVQDIPNLFYRCQRPPTTSGDHEAGGNPFERTFFDSWVSNLDALPFPARDLMDNSLYRSPDTGKPIATIQVARGCFGGCSYCLAPLISGKRIRQRSLHSILAELEECYHTYGIDDFFLRADTFTMDQAWVRTLCEMIKASDLAGMLSFVANARVKPLDAETLMLLKEAGCRLIAFGYESGSDETLRRIGKGATTQDNRNAARWAREAGLEVFGFFMVGFPWEDTAALEQTRTHIFELNPDYVEIHLAYPYFGTKLYQQFQDAGLLHVQPIGTDYFSSSVTGTTALSAAELSSWRARTLRAFYLQPVALLRRIRLLVTRPAAIGRYLSYALRLFKGSAR